MTYKHILSCVSVVPLLIITSVVVSPFSAPESVAQERIVSDEMLLRRWPNGVIPFRFGPNFDAEHKSEVRAAFFGSTTIAGCSVADPCIGWDAAMAARFIDCEAQGSDFCDKYKHTVYLIGTEPWAPDEANKTRGKRGYKNLKAESPLKPNCSLTNDDKNCRAQNCNFASGQACVFDVWLDNKSSFMWGGPHEFGHMLGFNHEQRRYDRDGFINTTACTDQEWIDSELARENFIGSYDTQSVMHYPIGSNCYSTLPGKPIITYGSSRGPTPKDLAKLQLLLGVRGDWLRNRNWCTRGGRTLHTGDFNRDGRLDLLCHSNRSGYNSSGRKWLDYSNSSGQFNGTNWSSGQGKFCWGGQRKLYTGDFDGDGDADVVCHNADEGSISIDHTNAKGELNGRDWPANGVHAWSCSGSTASLHVGDYNADGKDDLLCHDSASGVRKIDLANSAGKFNTFNWKSTDSGRKKWCAGSAVRFMVGDFDGDGSTDALCHNTSTGHRLIDYAFDHGNLKGTNWDSHKDGANKFCFGTDRVLHVADVNGDGADDLLCHNRRIGSVSVDRADKSKNWRDGAGLRGKNDLYYLAFCHAKNAQLITGAFGPDDQRADLLCHNTVTGHKAILYARPGGEFVIPAGY